METKGVTVILDIFTKADEGGALRFYVHPQTAREILALAPATGPNRFKPFERQGDLPLFTEQWRAALSLVAVDGRVFRFHESGAGLCAFADCLVFERLSLYLDKEAAIVGYTCDATEMRGHALRRMRSIFTSIRCVEERKKKRSAAHDLLERPTKRVRRTDEEQVAALVVLTAPLTDEEEHAKDILERYFH